MKHIYEKPTAETVIPANADILTLSGADGTGDLKVLDWTTIDFS